MTHPAHTPAADEDGFTELVDADFPRVDLVKQGANGFPGFLIAKSDGTGLLDPDTVRDLIAKGDPAPEQDRITVTGSPAAIAGMIHQAAGRRGAQVEAIAKGMDAYPDDPVDVAKAKAIYDLVVKAKYNQADRDRMASSGAAMEDGSYPIEDEEDLDNAIHAVGRGGASHNAIRKHIITRAKSLGKSSMIPDNWAADGSLKEQVSKDMADLDEGVDGLDPTVALAAPDEDRPGDPADPGSPAWEAIDAATAQKWTSILSRAKVAIDLLAQREYIEAASSDPDDIEHAFDLEDVCCAIDFAISVLAPFAVAEQSEADTGADALDGIAKAMAGFDTGPLDTAEGLLAVVAKAGRVLSGVNEQRIRNAAQSLQEVLSSLPSAPAAEEVTKGKDAAMDDGTDTTGTPGPDAADQVAKADGETAPAAGPDGSDGQDPAPVAKADGDGGDGDGASKLQAVFDQNGQLIGVVDPSAITQVAGAGGSPDDGDGEPAAEPAAADGGDGDLTPEPAADAGTPADGVAKATTDDPDGSASGTITIEADVLKSTVQDAVATALAAQQAGHEAVVAKMAEDRDDLAGQVQALEGRLATVEKSPAQPGVFVSGQVPPAHLLRGQNQAPDGGQPVDIAKARELRERLYHGTGPEQAEASREMQELAVGRLAQMHAAGPGRQGL